MQPYISILCLMAAAAAATPGVIPVTNDSIPAGAAVNWTADNTYLLTGFVFVKPGSRLTIAPGTVILAKEGKGSKASALIVSRGGRMYAKGTAAKPIIFTCDCDDPKKPDVVGYDPNATKGLWGGIVLCGRAPNNVNGQVTMAEGIPAEYGDLIKYGDSSNALDQTTGLSVDSAARARNTYDTSGVLQYVSIRRPGSELAPAKELNGLTLYSVGKGTTIDHIEVFNSSDDGFEWFGGTVDCKYLVSAFSDDDCFDYDQGYSGRCQFLFALQNSEDQRANRLGEFDSDDATEIPSSAGAKPYSKPIWYNCTFLGSGNNSSNGLNDFALTYKENAGGAIVNSIIGDVAGLGVNIEDKPNTGVDAYGRLLAGDIKIVSNIFFVRGDEICHVKATVLRDSLRAWHNLVTDPLLGGISRKTDVPDGKLDPRPTNGSPALADSNIGPLPPGSGFFVKTAYVGAFSRDDDWMQGWTLLSAAGFLKKSPGIKPAEQQPGGPAAAQRLEATVYGGKIVARYTLPRSGWVSVALYGLNGARTASLVNGLSERGAHTAGISTASLGKSTYLLRLTTDSYSTVKRIVVDR